jgi:mRNA-degrading endonuclease toxin of MazEF toxin-antitoxin module
MVAIITSTNKRAATEQTQLFIDLSTPDGKATGLLHPSTVKCEHLDTVNQLAIQRRIGQFSQALMDQLEVCLKKAMDIS